jgi:hypothetical protein
MAIPVWEEIEKTSTDITQRMLVPGGWLVCRINGSRLPQSLGTWFVDDPKHEWDVT